MFNESHDGQFDCAECGSGEANDQPVLFDWNGSPLPQALAGRAKLLEHGYVARWTIALGDGYTPTSDVASRLAHMYPEELWRHE